MLFWVGDEKQRAMASGGFNLALFQANDTWMLPIPATFVVGSDGVILARYVDPDYRRRMEVEDVLETLRADAKRRADQAR